MQTIRKYSGWLVLAALAVALGCVMTWAFPVNRYRIETGSMTPTMPVGSVVFTHPESSYSPGQVITFHANNGEIVTHRLIGITDSGEFITKGDANPTRDYWHNPVTKSDVMGAVIIIMAPITAPTFWISFRGIGIAICVIAIVALLSWKIDEEEPQKSPDNESVASPA